LRVDELGDSNYSSDDDDNPPADFGEGRIRQLLLFLLLEYVFVWLIKDKLDLRFLLLPLCLTKKKKTTQHLAFQMLYIYYYFIME